MNKITHEQIAQLAPHIDALSAIIRLGSIRSEREYDCAVDVLNQLIDLGSDENHVADLIDLVGNRIADYEKLHYQVPDVPVTELIKLLMDQHHLSQADLPEIGSQAVVSRVINGKIELNIRQIKALAARFHVPPALFVL